MVELICESFRERIADYYDGELSVDEQVAVEAHVSECPRCADEADRMRAVGDTLRAGAAAFRGRGNEVDTLGVTVVGRLEAERGASIGVHLRELFEDLHLVWVGFGALGVTLLCTAVVAAAFYFGAAPRTDSLSAIMVAIAHPGSNANPVGLRRGIEVPRMHLDAAMPLMLIGQMPEQDRAWLALAAVVTQEGRIARSEVLGSSEENDPWLDVADVASLARFAPARHGGAPVAVNVVWRFERATVRGG